MKVVIPCGGLGTRLREETEFRPALYAEQGFGVTLADTDVNAISMQRGLSLQGGA